MIHRLIDYDLPKEILTNEEVLKLIKKYRLQGDVAAKEKIARNYTRYLYNLIVNKYAAYSAHHDDLFTEGLLGVYKAVEKYDLTKKSNFLAFLSFWVKGNLEKVKNKYSCPLTVSLKDFEKMSALKKVKASDLKSHEQIAQEVGISSKSVKHLRSYPLQFIRVDSESYFEIEEKAETPFETFAERDDKRELLRQISNLQDKVAAQILLKRYGLENGEEHSVREIAKELGLSPPTVYTKISNSLTILQKKLNNPFE